ncbi:MAG TPA: PQQ-dependent sugar dehydrogenase [Pirellulales bacterium]|nr:PQQ-dependent sugar dehydrogenase [Pirellulales bacterium]
MLHRRHLRTAPLLLLLGLLVASHIESPARGEPGDSQGGKAEETPRQANRGLELGARIPWTTSNFRGSPDPPPPYRAERVWPNIHFKNPTVLTSAPGTDRLFVAEQAGKIFSVAQDPAAAAADPFLDCTELVSGLSNQRKEDLAFEAVYGLTFDPRFTENRYCYVCYVVRYRDGSRGQHPEGTRVSRFTVSRGDPPVCDPASEKLILSWLQGGHNGGCLKFGPEGYLYISTGDGGPAFPPDPLKAGQDVSNLLSAVLRIDVDREEDGRAYSIPADNPFASLAGARGEVWAYGLRNPWKMSFDRKTGDLWLGDVGWELWEMVYRVHKGDNFGWSLYEGRQPVHTERTRGPTPIVPPTVEIPHTEGASVTGGYVYRGQKIPELVGTYIFGDWETRRIWGVNAEGNDPGAKHEIMDPSVRVVDFGEDNEGEIYLLDYDAGTIHAIVKNPPPAEQHAFPRKLSETGIFEFESVAALRPAAGVVAYSINAEQWSDGAAAERLVGVPGRGSIRLFSEPQTIPGSMFTRSSQFPTDSVLVKTLSLERKIGDPSSRRPVETQVLHFDGRDWRGYTYEWNAEGTDATLVEATGKTRSLSVSDPVAPGGQRQQTWRYASRMECLRCHNPWSDNALGFNVRQLNRDLGSQGVADNQLRALAQIGLLEELAASQSNGNATAPPQPSKSPAELPRFVDPYDSAAEINQRARTYLHVNCAHCHRDGGGGSAYVHLLYDLPLEATRALAVRPSQGTFGIHDAKIIAPGDPYRSALYFRMAKLGPGHMPFIGTSIVDPRGLELIHDWIRQLPARPADQSLVERLVGLDASADQPPDERQRASVKQVIDDLLSESSRAAMLFRLVQHRRLRDETRQAVVEAAMRHHEPAIRDLFESFVPEEKRPKRLGEALRASELLKLAGDLERGRQLFHKTTGIQCRNCHRIAGDGTDLGPDLSQIARKQDRSKLLESILDPSKNVEPQYVTWLVETTSGRVYMGLLVHKDGNEMVIKDSENKQHRIATGDVEAAVPQQKSLMPDLLLKDFTAQQVADLLEYLASLK